MAPTESWRDAVLEAGREAGIGALTELTVDALKRALSVLRDDPDLLQTARSSSAANLALVTELLARQATLADLDPPPQAIAFARELARRNVPVADLARAYRVAELALWRWAVGEVRARVPEPGLADAVEGVSQAAFETGDVFATLVTRRYALERERWVRSADAVRSATVQELLAGSPIDSGSASRRLRYELRQRHAAFVVWGESEGSVTETAAAGVGGPRALLLPMGPDLIAGWAPPDAISPEAADRGAHVALGSPGEGLAGFRSSHLEAMEARRVARLLALDAEPVHYDTVALLALLTKDMDQARAFAQRTLGPVAADDPATRRLAETLLIVLEEEGRPRRAAARLGVHENTVAKRLRAIRDLLDADPAERPAEMLAALLILRAGRGETGRQTICCPRRIRPRTSRR